MEIEKELEIIRNNLKLLGINEITENILETPLQKYLGKGKNAVVYKFKLNNKSCSIKIMKLYMDTPLFLRFDKGEIISQPSINDIIISSIISKLSYIPSVPYFCGYKIDNDNIFLLKQYAKYSFEQFLQSGPSQQVISSLLIHFIIGIYLTFQLHNKGYHFDLKMENVLVNKTEDSTITYDLGFKKLTLQTLGYCPMLTDFGSSVFLEVDRSPLLIKRHTLWKKTPVIKGDNFSKMSFKIESITKDVTFFDKSYDVFKLFHKLKRVPIMRENFIFQEYHRQLKDNYQIYSTKYYKSNSLTILKFLNSDTIKKWIETNLS